jgi:glycolate oxidase FAD binding subunit
LSPEAARKQMIKLSRQYLPVTAMSYWDNIFYIRLSGTRSAVAATVKNIGGEPVTGNNTFWNDILEQQHPFFKSTRSLWRLSIPAVSNWPDIMKKFDNHCLVDWGGALVWVLTDEAPETIFAYAKSLGGHARLFRQAGSGQQSRHQPLQPGLLNWHKKIKHAFDPAGILNPGYMYREV